MDTDSADILIKLQDVINLLIADGELISSTYKPTIKPTHGPCCTCQSCGYDHDSCVCYSNELLAKLKAIKKR